MSTRIGINSNRNYGLLRQKRLDAYREAFTHFDTTAAVARHLGVHYDTAARWRKELGESVNLTFTDPLDAAFEGLYGRLRQSLPDVPYNYRRFFHAGIEAAKRIKT